MPRIQVSLIEESEGAPEETFFENAILSKEIAVSLHTLKDPLKIPSRMLHYLPKSCKYISRIFKAMYFSSTREDLAKFTIKF